MKPGSTAASVRKSEFPGDGPSWAAGKWPIFKFVGLFAILMVVFYAITFIPFLNLKVLPGLQILNANVSTWIMNIFGENARAMETTIVSPRYSVNIAHGCDAIEPAGLFAAAVLAFPVAFRWKLTGLVVGVSTLLVLNLVRIVSLFYAGVLERAGTVPKGTFELMHIDIWQPAFVLLSLLFWVVWALWATRPAKDRGIPARAPADK